MRQGILKYFIFLLVSIFALWITPNAEAQSKRPNVLFFFADDQRADTLAAFGNENISTPNLDRIAKLGTSFRRAYIMGALQGAVCLPSRAMMLSGRTLWRAPKNLQNVTTLPEIFRNLGYMTFGTGKWHNGGPSFLRGFEFGKGVFLGGMCDHFNVPAQIVENGKLKKYMAKGEHSSEIFANAAIEFLQKNVGKEPDRPFFMYVAFTAPHDPRDAPLKYRQSYYKKRPPLPKNYMPQHPFNNGQLVIRDEDLAPWPRTKEVIQDQLAEYYALITHMDEQIGRILEALRETGQYDNTIIIFSADNGLAVGSHGLLGKQNLYQHSVNVPLMFSGPGIPKNQQRDALVYLFDILPTLCDMVGTDVPKGVEGKSLLPVIQGKKTEVRDSVYTVYRDIMRGLTDQQYSLICYPKINHVQLFDLKNDPNELKNLAGDPAYADRVAKMKKELLAWEKSIDAPERPLTVANPMKMEIDLTGHKRNPDRSQPLWIRNKYFSK